MGKLTNVRPRLVAVVSRLPRMTDEHGHDARSEHWRNWYKLARWQRLRQRVFVRDGYVCQRSGVICAGSGDDPNAPVANHIRAHRGDPVLFWDEDNIETVTKQVHDTIIQRAEAAARARGQI
jgi:5-methylcytosine-specific restriction protein A